MQTVLIVPRKEKKTPIEDEANKSCGHTKENLSPVKSRRSSGSRYEPQSSVRNMANQSIYIVQQL